MINIVYVIETQLYVMGGRLGEQVHVSSGCVMTIIACIIETQSHVMEGRLGEQV